MFKNFLGLDPPPNKNWIQSPLMLKYIHCSERRSLYKIILNEESFKPLYYGVEREVEWTWNGGGGEN